VPLRALSLQSNPFVVSPELKLPLKESHSEGYQAVVKYATPISEDFAAIGFENGVLRYAARFGERYVVDFSGTFEQYLANFSGKSRNTLKRKVKKAISSNKKVPIVCEYATQSEITRFRDIAVAISHRSYKKELGWGFREDEKFARELENDARAGMVRGYVLNLDDQPAAYVFCRIDHDVIIYKHLAHEDRFMERSPGTVLLYLIIERLFTQKEFRLLDFDGMEHIPYKEFFSTRMVRCARILWLRPTARNIVMVTAHWLITAAWRFATARRDAARRREWASVRRLSRRWARVLTRPHLSR
jgi:hypothetical protein